MAVDPIIPVIDYTSRDYEAIRADLIQLIRERLPYWSAQDPSDFGVAMVEAIAYAADQLHYYLDRVANEAYLGTALQRESLTAIAQMFGYRPYEARAATVVLEFTNSSTEDILVPAGARIQATLNQNDTTVVRTFETDQDVLVGGINAAFPARTTATEGRTYPNERLGVSTGLAFQRMRLPRSSVLTESLRVTTTLGESTVSWARYNRLEDASDEDRAYMVEKQSDGSTVIIFGDGINGEIPALHSVVSASYRVGGGAVVVPIGALDTMVDPLIPTISVTNPVASSGGRDAESLDSIRINAARAFRARDRAVTLYDFMAMAKVYPGISKAKAVANNGVSTTVFVTAVDDGTGRPRLSYEQELEIKAYLESKAMAGVTVTILDAAWIKFYVSVTVHCRPTARRSVVEKEARQVLARLFSFDNMDFDQRITLADINSALYQVPGLAYAVIDQFNIDNGTSVENVMAFDEFAVNGIPWYDEATSLTLTVEGGL